jgi:hypothetical protein
MKTTLGKIKEFTPCQSGWKKLCKGLGTNSPDTEVTILQILEINGVKDTFWALRTQEYKNYCLILADIAESVLYIYEEKNSSTAPRKAIEGVRLYHSGDINHDELKALADAAAYAATAADAAAAHAAAAAAHAAAYAADAYDAAAYADAAAYVAAATAAAAADADADAAHAARRKQWALNEEILRRHLEGKGGVQ